MLNLTVGKSGKEDYYYLQEAIDAVPYNTAAVIDVREGIYREKIFSDKKDLTIRGEGNVLITYNDSGKELMADGLKRGTFRSYTAFFSGERLRLENMTIENSAGDGKRVGQAIALYLDADFAELDGVDIIGRQDTLFLAPLPDEAEREKRGFYGPRSFLPRKRNMSIFRHCMVEGTVDFIFGSGDALFSECRIISTGRGYVTAPSTPSGGIGLVFDKCSFSVMCEKDYGEVFIMRPWRRHGRISLFSCDLGEGFSPSLWCAWPGHEDEKADAACLIYCTEASGDMLTELSAEEAEDILSSFSRMQHIAE